MSHSPARVLAPPRLGSFLLGLGLGGFVDGIVVHQLLQWHHMISHVTSPRTLAGLQLNTVADGFFHAGTWLLVLAGSLCTIADWRAGRSASSWRHHLGLLLLGWGVFNLVEGLVDHQILGVHHLRDDLGAPLSWDIGFLVFGAALAMLGWLLQRSSAASGATPPAARPTP